MELKKLAQRVRARWPRRSSTSSSPTRPPPRSSAACAALFPRARRASRRAHCWRRPTTGSAAPACRAPSCWRCATSRAASPAATLPTLAAAHGLGRCRDRRAADRSARHRPLERGDVPDVPSRPARRAAARRLQPAQRPMRRRSRSARCRSPEALEKARREVAALSHGGELVSVADAEQAVTSQAVKLRSRAPLE